VITLSRSKVVIDYARHYTAGIQSVRLVFYYKMSRREKQHFLV